MSETWQNGLFGCFSDIGTCKDREINLIIKFCDLTFLMLQQSLMISASVTHGVCKHIDLCPWLKKVPDARSCPHCFS